MDRGAGLAANKLLDAVEREAANRRAADRVDDFTGFHSRTSGGHLLDRLHDDAAVFELVNVHADAAEVPAAQRFVESLNLAWRQIDRVGVLERIEHSAQSGLGEVAAAVAPESARVMLLHVRQLVGGASRILADVATGVCRRNGGVGNFLRVQVAAQGRSLAVDQRLRIDRFVVAAFELA